VRKPSTILAAKAAALVRHAELLGLDRGRLLSAAHLCPGVIERSDGRVALEAMAALWSDLARLTGRPDLGLAVAEAETTPSAFGVVGFRAMTSGTLDEALRSFVRYNHLVNEGAEAGVAYGHDSLTFALVLPASTGQISRCMADRAMASCLRFARAWTAEPLKPRRLQLRHERPRDTSAYERVFDCRVDFGAPTNAVVFDRAVASLPLRVAPADVAFYLESLAAAASADLPRDDAAGAVSEVVRGSLAVGDPGLAKVARRLGVSQRTLQRRLLAEGLTYHGVVDRVRREAAVTLVASPLPLALVGERVGYADAKAFRRAFRRWTGLSPAEFRRAPAAFPAGSR
jgi:AraC-like DNA-binding protein